MITCEFCGTQAEQHDHWRHLMVARVAALEEFVTREPAEDEQPVSAGEAPKRCPHGVPSHLGCWNCTSRYVKIGDVVMDEPPAEQPTGCPGCACCNDDACPVRHTNCETLCRDRAKAKAAGQPDGGPRSGNRVPGHLLALLEDPDSYLTAENAALSGLVSWVSAQDPINCVARASTDGVHLPWDQFAWQPANTDGALTEGIRTPAAEQAPTTLNLPGQLNGYPKPAEPPARTPILDEADLWQANPAEPSGTGQLPSAPVGTLRDAGLIADTMPNEVLAMLYERATDTLIETRQLRKDQVAALEARLAQAERERDEWRPRYEAAAADARTLREAWARAERERDELGRQVEQMAAHVAKMRMELDEAVERLKCEACTDAKSILCATCIDREERDATARERERCLAWAQADIDNGEIATAIDNGAPAPKCDPPREVAPDRTQAGSGGPKCWECGR